MGGEDSVPIKGFCTFTENIELKGSEEQYVTKSSLKVSERNFQIFLSSCDE